MFPGKAFQPPVQQRLVLLHDADIVRVFRRYEPVQVRPSVKSASNVTTVPVSSREDIWRCQSNSSRVGTAEEVADQGDDLAQVSLQ
jgi:hypothetical protein